jgi:hypothetical protein
MECQAKNASLRFFITVYNEAEKEYFLYRSDSTIEKKMHTLVDQKQGAKFSLFYTKSTA